LKNTAITKESLKKQTVDRLNNVFSVVPEKATNEQVYKALSGIVRTHLEDQHRRHEAKTYGEGEKQVYYLSMEFLVGRSLKNNLYNLGINKQAEATMQELGFSLNKLYEIEPDAALGNGGLGRLAACYMDALATDGYTATGYSILYEYGIFKQKIIEGWQQELPDNWLPMGDVWLREKRDEAVEVKFDGEISESWMENYHHINYENYNSVLAVPYDMYISGYDTTSVSKLRVWKAVAPGIDMESFNRGDYAKAVHAKGTAELISSVLYPNDDNQEGKILRLRQQYFLCCASINDIVQKHLAQYGTLENLPDKVAIQLNDTHPTFAIPELIRIMLDDCGYSWDKSVNIAKRTFAYTNHTVLSEALERWNVDMLRSVLPRIYQIIEEINTMLIRELTGRFPGDYGKISYMSIIDGSMVRMANLCVYMSHSTNGVSRLHSEIIKEELFNDFYLFAPDKFTNVTNGIAYRRWLLQSNGGLTRLLTDTIGDKFMRDASALKKFEKFADNKKVLDALDEIKLHNKLALAHYCKNCVSHPVNPESIFDVQAKRMHEYKRQHLNAMYIIHQYLTLKDNPGMNFVPRTYLFGAKAAPGYYLAKQMIRLICGLQRLLESDEALRDKLRVVYLEDYRVTVSEILMPAAEVSEQISLAGKEASGTGNMKLMLNGAITLGTLDGANIEIRDSAGADNFFLFGMTKEQVLDIQAEYNPEKLYKTNADIKSVIDFMEKGFDGNSYIDLANNLKYSDPYMVLADFESYCDAQKRVSETYPDRDRWNRMSLMNIANSGVFSADRAVNEYAREIWRLNPVK